MNFYCHRFPAIIFSFRCVFCIFDIPSSTIYKIQQQNNTWKSLLLEYFVLKFFVKKNKTLNNTSTAIKISFESFQGYKFSWFSFLVFFSSKNHYHHLFLCRIARYTKKLFSLQGTWLWVDINILCPISLLFLSFHA